MTRLDDYRSALLVADPEVAPAALVDVLEAGGSRFVPFVIDHGLGPRWHARTGRTEFHASRLSAEALYLAQGQALGEVDAVLDDAGIEHAVIKGAASRLLLYDNPAIRPCHDLDLLVRPEDRVKAAAVLVDAGFTAVPEPKSISRELVLSRGPVDIDLHWQLLREGRLRKDHTADMLTRRQRSNNLWMLSGEDSFFVLLVHPAFAKHVAGWEMGLHRVVDIIEWLRTQSIDWPAVCERVREDGVAAAAWATLKWVDLLMSPNAPTGLAAMLSDTRPGDLRAAWLDRWLRSDLSARMSDAHALRLLGFSLFLHDTLRDSMRAFAGRRRAHRRVSADLAAFRDLTG
jgi:hypothetical protein